MRGTVQVFGLIGLAWSATAAFTVLTRNINQAWPNADRHNFIKMRLMAFAMMAGVAVVMVVLLIANTAMRFLPQSVAGAAGLIIPIRNFSRIIIWLLLFVALTWLYRWLPNTDVRWS